MTRIKTLTVVLLSIIALAGCGSGGGNNNAAPKPSESIAPSVDPMVRASAGSSQPLSTKLNSSYSFAVLPICLGNSGVVELTNAKLTNSEGSVELVKSGIRPFGEKGPVADQNGILAIPPQEALEGYKLSATCISANAPLLGFSVKRTAPGHAAVKEITVEYRFGKLPNEVAKAVFPFSLVLCDSEKKSASTGTFAGCSKI